MHIFTTAKNQTPAKDGEDMLPNALNAIRVATGKIEFSHLLNDPDLTRRLRNILTFQKEAAPALCYAWEYAIHATMPEVIFNVALGYYASALNYCDDVLNAASTAQSHEPSLFDQVTANALKLLNEMAAWKMMGYQPFEKKWSSRRLILLENWLRQKLDCQTEVNPESHEPQLLLSNPATQTIGLHPELSAALVHSMLLELAGAESLTRPEISMLVQVIRRASEHIKLHSQLDATGGFCIDNLNGKTRRESQGCLGGITLHAEDVRCAVENLRLQKIDWGSHLSEQSRDRLLEKMLSNNWSAAAARRKVPRIKQPLPVSVHHGYNDVLRTLAHPGESTMNQYIHNKPQIIDISEHGCSVLMPKWLASPAFAPGRIVILGSDLLEPRQKHGIVVWMKQHETNPQMLQFSMEFFGGPLHISAMRCESAFPSGLKVELLAQISLPDEEMALILPKDTHHENLQLTNQQSGERIKIGNILISGQDFDVVDVLPEASPYAESPVLLPLPNSAIRMTPQVMYGI